MSLPQLAPKLDKFAPQDIPAAASKSGWELSARLDWALALPVSSAATLVAVGLIKFTGADTGLCWPSIGKLEKLTKLSRPTVIKAIRELESGGHVTIQRLRVGRVNAANRYRIPRVGVVKPLNHPSKATLPEPGIEPVRSTHTARERVSCSVHDREWFKDDGPSCYECARSRLLNVPGPQQLPARMRVGRPSGEPVVLTSGDLAAIRASKAREGTRHAALEAARMGEKTARLTCTGIGGGG